MVATRGVPEGDGIPQQCGLTSWGDGPSNEEEGRGWWEMREKRQKIPGTLRDCKQPSATPNGAGSQSGGTESPAPPVLAAHGALVGDGSPLLHGLTGSRNGESKPAGRRSSQCACGGWRPPMARAHKLGERGDQPSQWSQLTVRSWVISACDGAGSQATGTESPAQLVVAPHGGPVGLLTAWAHTLGRREIQPM